MARWPLAREKRSDSERNDERVYWHGKPLDPEPHQLPIGELVAAALTLGLIALVAFMILTGWEG